MNYEKVGLRVKDGTYVKKEEILKKATNGKNSRYPPSLLCIEDPMDESNNVSRSSYAVPAIIEAFVYAFEMLTKAVGPNQAVVGKEESILGRIIRITDEVMVRRDNQRKQFIELLSNCTNDENGRRGNQWYNRNQNRYYRDGNEWYNPKKNWIQRHNHGHQNFGNGRYNSGQRRQEFRRWNPNRKNFHKGYYHYEPQRWSYYSFDNHLNHQRLKAQQLDQSNHQNEVREESEAYGGNHSNGSQTGVQHYGETRPRANTLR